MIIKRLLFICSILTAACLLISCPAEDRKTAVLCTDRPEFTSYVESFNTSQDEYRIIIAYDENPGDDLQPNGKCEYDLIIDSHLNSVRHLPGFMSLEKFFEDEVLQRSMFYSDLLEQGVYNEEQVLLPISFNLPALMFKSDLKLAEQDGFMLNMDQLAELNRQFSSRTEKGFTTLGLSLRWNPEMLYLLTLLMDTGYRESETGALLWNSGGLKESVDYIRTWTAEFNGGITAEREFAQKFMVEPPYNLIAGERILCYYRDLADFYSLPPQKRERLKILWPASDDEIPVLPDVLFAAMPAGARGTAAARAFLAWFFSVKTQEELLASTQYKRLRTFGIAGGFSSMPVINEQVLPRYYPDLVGYIPGPEYLSFPPPLPPEWPQIKSEVLMPWLIEQADSEMTSELMRERLEVWMRQRPPK
ncbi:MAG: hypothetical protein ACP5IA_02120 [Sediminispirochaetaceae bacterium]